MILLKILRIRQLLDFEDTGSLVGSRLLKPGLPPFIHSFLIHSAVGDDCSELLSGSSSVVATFYASLLQSSGACASSSSRCNASTCTKKIQFRAYIYTYVHIYTRSGSPRFILQIFASTSRRTKEERRGEELRTFEAPKGRARCARWVLIVEPSPRESFRRTCLPDDSRRTQRERKMQPSAC